MSEWTIVMPVKGTTASKSRFGPGDHRDLALAMALDTVATAVRVASVIVVTVGGAEFQALGATVVQEHGGGLAAAIDEGLAASPADRRSAVLLADHPALQAAELSAALAAAAPHERAFVADAEGTGTALLAARTPAAHDHAFGTGSRAAHLARGYVELAGTWPGLRRDIDVPDHLEDLPLGPRTTEFLRR